MLWGLGGRACFINKPSPRWGQSQGAETVQFEGQAVRVVENEARISATEGALEPALSEVQWGPGSWGQGMEA